MSASCPTCHHLHPAGKRCGSPALRGEQFCFYHHPTRRPPVRTRPAHTAFYVPAIADPETLQMALSEVIRRIADTSLDTKRARLLLSTLQMAKANLSSMPGQSASHFPAASLDFPDLSGLLSAAGLQPTPSVPKH